MDMFGTKMRMFPSDGENVSGAIFHGKDYKPRGSFSRCFTITVSEKSSESSPYFLRSIITATLLPSSFVT
jgi:hypothetical protein